MPSILAVYPGLFCLQSHCPVTLLGNPPPTPRMHRSCVCPVCPFSLSGFLAGGFSPYKAHRKSLPNKPFILQPSLLFLLSLLSVLFLSVSFKTPPKMYSQTPTSKFLVLSPTQSGPDAIDLDQPQYDPSTPRSRSESSSSGVSGSSQLRDTVYTPNNNFLVLSPVQARRPDATNNFLVLSPTQYGPDQDPSVSRARSDSSSSDGVSGSQLKDSLSPLPGGFLYLGY